MLVISDLLAKEKQTEIDVVKRRLNMKRKAFPALPIFCFLAHFTAELIVKTWQIINFYRSRGKFSFV